MSLVVNLRHLAAHSARLRGELSAGELDIDTRDEVIQLSRPLEHDIEVQKLEGGLLLQGHLRMILDCQCVRCLKRFQYPLELKGWTCHVPLEGEERAAVVNDCVDLTPYVREDILLEFPQHPLCNPKCGGFSTLSVDEQNRAGMSGKPEAGSSAWAELNKLKF